ncbi:GRP family sugar transporter [Sporolactobacillus vineae]|uniref:GRP family sugar transporter n=1 Tax=Sporolactobacillus vineae TaxID=444463 RepID=UPI001EE68E6C|nr:GRP family sugar transporter [Sporolactobacillus vineae]
MYDLNGLLIALIPALLWGTLPLVCMKNGGKPAHQVFGMTIGALLFSLFVSFIYPPDFDPKVMMIGFISGLFWTIGQFYQFASMQTIGVSKTMPFSTGTQLAGAALFGVIIFKEWDTSFKLTIGFLALLLIITGVLFTSYEGKARSNRQQNGHLFRGIGYVFLSTLGYLAYLLIIRYFNLNGWSIILSQSVGMIVGSLVFSARTIKEIASKYTFRNITSGLMWGGGNIALLIATKLEGVATSFSMSQIGTVLSTLGGIFLLHEKKTRKQFVLILIGCLLITVGGIFLGMTKR